MLAYTYLSHGKFELIDKPKPELQSPRDAIVRITLGSICTSDHYPFAVRNVPCIFFMNENGDAFKYYHTVYDTWLNSIFDYYEPTFKFLVDFVDRY